jgi:hypothetical protein
MGGFPDRFPRLCLGGLYLASALAVFEFNFGNLSRHRYLIRGWPSGRPGLLLYDQLNGSIFWAIK